MTLQVSDIREALANAHMYRSPRNGTAELRNVMFEANEDSIFGEPNKEYIKAEIEWYLTESSYVQKLYDIYGKKVAIWDSVKDDAGCINSQYGRLVYTHGQYQEVYFELMDNPTSRQAVMYYAPGHNTQKLARSGRVNGVRDHVCTTSVQYFIVNSKLEVQVNMRSNDAIFGYPNDLAWQKHVQHKLCSDLTTYCEIIKPGKIMWCAGSLHVYERHYNLIEEWMNE